MNLHCNRDLAKQYKSGCQIARVVTEDWCARELYCPACVSDHLAPTKTNTAVVDFFCPTCEHPFQLKSQKNWSPRKLTDGAYETMRQAILRDKAPSMLILQYSPGWSIRNLLLIPRYFFSASVIQKRNPLTTKARRAGWVGCNILLSEIPSDGKIQIVSSGIIRPKKDVRSAFDRIRSLANIPSTSRGWALDVLHVIRQLGGSEFNLRDVYFYEQYLQNLHPENRHIKPKIRQQLQVLRDLNLIRFRGNGRYSTVCCEMAEQ